MNNNQLIALGKEEPISPYAEAWRWIESNPGTGSARGLAKLLLSLWNDTNAAFSFRECVDKLDKKRRDLALRVVNHFAVYGEDHELLAIGERLCEDYSELWHLGRAATRAKRQLEKQWQEGVTATELQGSDPKKTKFTVEVPSERSDAFMEMYREFVFGDTKHDVEIRERAAQRNQGIASLRKLVNVAQGNSGQCRYIAWFLASLYNAWRFPLDLRNFRAIDNELFEHAMAVLRLDRHPEKEVHRYFVDGSSLWEEGIIGRWNLTIDSLAEAARRLAEYFEESHPDRAKLLSVWRREIDPSV